MNDLKLAHAKARSPYSIAGENIPACADGFGGLR